MKTKTTAIVASLVIIALASSAIIGATYSWFEDEDKVTAVFYPGKISIDAEITDLKAKNCDNTGWIEKGEDGTVTLDSGAKVSLKYDSTTDATSTSDAVATSVIFKNAAPGDSVTFKMKITNNSTIKNLVWTAYATGGDATVDGKKIFDIFIKHGNPETIVSGYKEFGTNSSVEVTVTISIDTEITSMPPSSEVTITAKATQLAATLPTINP